MFKSRWGQIIYGLENRKNVSVVWSEMTPTKGNRTMEDLIMVTVNIKINEKRKFEKMRKQ